MSGLILKLNNFTNIYLAKKSFIEILITKKLITRFYFQMSIDNFKF